MAATNLDADCNRSALKLKILRFLNLRSYRKTTPLPPQIIFTMLLPTWILFVDPTPSLFTGIAVTSIRLI